MIIAVCAVFAVAMFAGYYIADRNDLDWASATCMTFGLFSCVAAIVMTVTAIAIACGATGYAAACHERYESLVYQAEADMYNNDNEIGKKELMNQIQSWNEDLAIGKARQRDLWVGVFYPNIYDDFDFIPPDLVK